MITTTINIKSHMLGHYISMTSHKQAAFIRREGFNCDVTIFENHLGESVILLNERQYTRLISYLLPKWESEGNVDVK